MKKLPSLSVFYPSLNDSKILPYLIYRTYQVLPKITKDFEVIVINDGSTDDTYEVLEHLKKMYKNFIPIHHKKNKGYGGALISGFNRSSKEWVFYTDGDGQYDPTDLFLLLAKLEKNIDVVNGYKLDRLDGVLRKVVGTSYNAFLHKIHSLPISDVDCDFRLIKKNALNKITLKSTSGMICLELVMKLHETGAIFKEVGVNHYPRRFGKSQFFNIRRINETLNLSPHMQH